MQLIKILFLQIRLFVTSITLAISQIYTNKLRSMLTITGIIIGVASVATIISVLTSFEKSILQDFKNFGANKIFVYPSHPDTDDNYYLSWNEYIFKPEQFKGLLKNCDHVEKVTRLCRESYPIKYNQISVNNISIHGVDPDWHDIENKNYS